MAAELRGLLGIDDIERVDDTAFKTVEVPEWGGSIRIGTINAGTMLEYVKSNDTAAKFNSGLRMIVDSLVDANGKRIGQLSHMEMLKKKNNMVIQKVAEEILKLNGVEKKPFDFQDRLKEAGEDPTKLGALIAVLRQSADSLEAAGTDKEKLKAVAAGKVEEDAKNSSGGTP
ncbi:MAG TPA: hypothetical protein VM531_11070 [Sphingomicrobium sp.]|jgi:hypothetical protein|nr:hypothetical protein [Sphingomicrobium sp.]